MIRFKYHQKHSGASLRFVFMLIMFCCAFFPRPVRAQDIPTTSEPEALERQLERVPEPLTGPTVIFPELLERPIPPGVKGPSFVLEGIELEGVTVYDESKLTSFFENKIGQSVTFQDLRGIAQAITDKYRNDGYILSRAIFPMQVVEEGCVRLQVLEGYFSSYVIDESYEGPKDRLEAYAKKIIRSRPLKNRELERYLLLMNDLPGLEVTSVIRPASGIPGAAVLVLQVREKRLSVAAELNNRGSRFVGPHHLSLSVQAEGYLGWDERISGRMLAASQTDEMRYANLTYHQTFGSEGLTGYVSGAYSTQEPGFTLNQFDVDSRSRTLTFGVEYPLLRSRNKNFRLGLDFDIRNSRSEIADVLFSRDRIRSLRLRATYDFLDSLGGVNVIQTELSQGISIFGASDDTDQNLSRFKGKPEYTKISAYLSRNQHLFDKWSVFAAVTGQYAFDTLLSSEEFAFGGANFGSAYDASEITGDHGAAIRTEARWSWTGEPITWVQLYGFHDYGCVWRRESTRESQLDAASAGFGIRLRAGKNLSATAEIAKPLTRKVGAEDDREARAFFSVLYQH